MAECAQIVLSGQIALPVITTPTNQTPAKEILRLPPGTDIVGQLTIKNVDASAIVYLKWSDDPTSIFQTAEAGILLAAGDSYTWNALPKAKSLLAVSSVANSRIAADGIAQVRPS